MEEEKGFGESIVDALNAEETKTETTEVKTTETTDTPPAWDKTERRAKGYEGEKRRATEKVDPDPEHEMEFELEEGKGKHKLKTSQLKSLAKELFENKGAYNYGLGMMKAGQEHPEFRSLMDKIVAMSFKDLKNFDPEFVTKTLAQLEGKAEKIADKVEEKDDLIDEMQAQLEDLDPDSPQAGILKKSIAYQKGLKAQFQKQMGEGQKRIDALEAKLNGVEKTHKDFLSEKDKEAQSVEVKRLSGIYEKEIGALTDKEKKDGYKFIDEDEAKEFDAAVRNSIATGAKNVKDDASFVTLIQNTAKAIYDKIGKRRESWVSDYLKKKGQPPKEKDEPPKKKEDEKPDERSIGQMIADDMFAET